MARAHCMAVARDPTTGAALLSATVNVYNPGTVTPISATMFDKSGNTLSNPLTSDAGTGLIDFYLNVAQEVDLVVSKASYTTRTYSNVPVLDDASNDLSALMTTTGDLAYASANNTPARLPIGASNALLTVSGGVPSWATTIGGTINMAILTLSGLLTANGGITSNGALTVVGALLTGQSGLTISAGNVNLGNGSSNLGFFGVTNVLQQAVSGSRSGGAALTNLLTALANYGLIVNNTTA